MKIGELSKATQTPVETIRYYEKEGLLPSNNRSTNNYRIYSEDHVKRLQFIKRCRTLDMTLNEIRTLLRFNAEEEDNCREVNALLDEHLLHVTTRIKELKQLEKQLKDLRHYCNCREMILKSGQSEHQNGPCLCKKGNPHCGILVELFQHSPYEKRDLSTNKKQKKSHVK